MKSVVRSFIALEIAGSVRSEIEKTTRLLAESVPAVKRMDAEQFHLTLKFLGDVPAVELHRVIRAVEAACQTVEPFDLFFEQIGAFPDAENPHTLWVGLTAGIDETGRLAERINDELARLGFPKERRRLTPHLTVGRVRDSADDAQRDALARFLAENQQRSFGASEVVSVTIFSSELDRKGPKYDVLAEIDLMQS